MSSAGATGSDHNPACGCSRTRESRQGAELRLNGPYGVCVLSPSAMADQYLLIAGGSGIASMLSRLRDGALLRRHLFGRAVVSEDHVKVGADLDRFDFVPSSRARRAKGGDEARGFVHEAADGWLRTSSGWPGHAASGPHGGAPAMIAATFPLPTRRHDFDARDIAFDESPDRHRPTMGQIGSDGERLGSSGEPRRLDRERAA